MKPTLTLGWILVFTGTVFLVSGLVVMIFATLNTGVSGGMSPELQAPSFWVNLANSLMEFVLKLLAVEWTPARAGVFLIVIGLLVDAGGMVAIFSAAKPASRRKPRRKTRRK